MKLHRAHRSGESRCGPSSSPICTSVYSSQIVNEPGVIESIVPPCCGHHAAVGAAMDQEFVNLHEEIRRQLHGRLRLDAVERRLHRAGRNLERLQEKGADRQRHDRRHDEDLHVLAPAVPRRGRERACCPASSLPCSASPGPRYRAPSSAPGSGPPAPGWSPGPLRRECPARRCGCVAGCPKSTPIRREPSSFCWGGKNRTYFWKDRLI